MRDYWAGLSDRERGLLLGCGILALLVFSWLLVIRPIGNYRTTAAHELEVAEELYGLVADAGGEVKALRAAGQPAQTDSDGEPLRVAVALAARSAGVSISRIQPSEDGLLTIWADDVASPAFYRWVTTLANEQQITPVKVSLQKSGNSGRLRAQLQFEEAR